MHVVAAGAALHMARAALTGTLVGAMVGQSGEAGMVQQHFVWLHQPCALDKACCETLQWQCTFWSQSQQVGPCQCNPAAKALALP